MNKKTKNNIPTLRFIEFNKEWKEDKIGDITNITAGGTPSTLNPKYWGGDIKWMSSGELNYKKVYDVKGRITLEGLNNSSTKIIPKFSVLIGLAGQGKTRGTVAINMAELCINQSIAAIYPSPLFDSNFLYQELDRRYSEIRRLSTGDGGRGGLNLKILNNLNITLPEITEQQKIADFLGSIDKKIEQLSNKKELLEQYKKGMMQQSFSQELRFKDDNGNTFPDWERKKAEEIFSNHSNKKHNGDLSLLAVTQDQGVVYRDSIDIDIKTSQESILSYKIVEKGDFVISLRSFQGGIEYSKVKGICSPAYTVLKPKIEIADLFYRFYLKKESFIKRLAATVIGIRDGKQISYSSFAYLKLPYPNPKEQQKIADFLSSIDSKIEQVSKQLEKMQEFKKGLLQQMFV